MEIEIGYGYKTTKPKKDNQINHRLDNSDETINIRYLHGKKRCRPKRETGVLVDVPRF